MSIHHSIIKAPLFTEMSTDLRDENKYVFDVAIDSDKLQIRKAIEAIFDVKVESVNTMIVKGKKKRVGRFVGYKPNWKKAIIKLQDGQTIDRFGDV